MTDNNIHIRYCCFSKPFRNKLVELGFEEKGSDHDSYGLKQIRRFYKNNLLIEDGYNGTYLYAFEDKPGIKGVPTLARVLKYHGLSVNKELLENFSKKGIYNQ